MKELSLIKKLIFIFVKIKIKMKIDIHRKLKHMTKSQLDKVCHKMNCHKGTKREMIVNLLIPLRMKYKMRGTENSEELPSDLMGIIAKNTKNLLL